MEDAPLLNMTVRAAEPSDIHFLADIMYQSMLPGVGRGIFDVALGESGVDPITFHEALLRTGANNWGQLESFLVVQDPQGRRAGATGAYLSSAQDLRPLTAEGLDRVSKFLNWPAATTRDFWKKYVSVFGLFGNAPQLAQPAEYVLEYSAVKPEFRGRGVYGILLEAHANKARALGFKTLGGTAMIGNETVFRSKLKFGFREHARFGSEYYGGVYPGLVRMIFDL